MSTPVWQPGTLYSPGAIVQPASAIPPTASPVVNGDFESGDTAWTKDAGWTIGAFGSGTHFTGTQSAQWNSTTTGRIKATAAFTVVPGQSITATAQVQQGASSAGQAGGRVEIGWYTSGDVLISYSSGNTVDSGSSSHWHQSSVTAVAPATAAKARIVGYAFRNSGSDKLWMDQFTWNLQVTALPAGLVFKATQANAGSSAATEPVWPLVLGGTVVDNQVTWEGVYASRVTWEATPILVSGSSEPAFPALANATVADNTIVWTAMTSRVAQAPNSRTVAIASSKIFAGDDDIVKFCATVNCLDWESPNDAGYLPFGLQTYGGTPVSALGLYRSNLVAFNSQGFQMWQVDQDPANMALLDAVPIPCQYPDTAVPVSNDLVFLTSRGVRSMGIAGASTNLQAGFFGQAVDQLVLEAIAAGDVPFALFYAAAGQYWLFFGEQAFVLTMTGKSADAGWSRYVFPEAITNWTILSGELYLRTATHKIWRVDPEVTLDDQLCSPEDAPVLSGIVQDDFYHSLDWTVTETPLEPVDGFRLYDADTNALILETTDVAYLTGFLGPSFERRYYLTTFNAAGDSPHSNIVDLTTAASGIIVDVFEASGTWTKRLGLDHVVVTVVGGGGGGAGGGGGPAPSRTGGGAGGGAYRLATFAAAALGATETVTVGAGGVGGAPVASGVGGVGGNNGASGGTSSFGSLSACTGGGGGLPYTGSGPDGSAGGTASGSGTSVTAESGGIGRKETPLLPGSTTWAGAGGGQADSQAGGTAAHSGGSYTGGNGGNGGLGHMDAPGDPGLPGVNYGGGGGGGGASGTGMVSGGPLSGAGGVGGKGVVVVENHIGA